ncbi:MAG: S24/S26 family peptidase [Desulfobacterales bacterium]|nr:S24/S26 family peptidase [Desulfobacterales bacterium]
MRFRAPGRSMHPTIRENEAVIVAPASASSLAVGDIVLCRSGDKITAHRLVGIDSDEVEVSPAAAAQPIRFTTRGDACIKCDPPVSPEQLLGKVVAVERRGRRIDPCGFLPSLYTRTYRFLSRLLRSLR